MNFYRSKNTKGTVEAVIPSYATPGSAGLDLTATWMEEKEGKYVEYGTNLHFEIPEGKVGLLFPRSSITETELTLKNCVGVIDSDYRGEVRFRFQPSTDYVNNLIKAFSHVVGIIAGAIVKRKQISAEEVMEKTALLGKVDKDAKIYKPGDKIGQLVIIDYHRASYLAEVYTYDEFSKTVRGDGGYGSTT